MDLTISMQFANGSTLSLDAESCSWGVSLPSSGGVPAGAASAADFAFIAPSSVTTTPGLESACETGAAIQVVTVTMTDPVTGSGLRWDMTSAVISSFQISGNTVQPFATDSVAINFAGITVTAF
jgi:hypothetical protein